MLLWPLLGAVATVAVAVDTSSPAKPYIKAEGGNFVVSLPFGATALLQFHDAKTGEVETAPSAVGAYRSSRPPLQPRRASSR